MTAYSNIHLNRMQIRTETIEDIHVSTLLLHENFCLVCRFEKSSKAAKQNFYPRRSLIRTMKLLLFSIDLSISTQDAIRSKVHSKKVSLIDVGERVAQHVTKSPIHESAYMIQDEYIHMNMPSRVRKTRKERSPNQSRSRTYIFR